MKTEKTKNLWFRMGVTIALTEEEYKLLRNGSSSTDHEEREKAAQLFLTKIRAGAFLADGETYSPEQQSWCNETEWPRDEEIGFELYEDMAPSATQVKVIMEEGTVRGVLKDRDIPLEVEIVDVWDDYQDYRQLSEYADGLFGDPVFKPCDYTTARFDNDGDESKMYPNTKIYYLYRDGGNNKIHNECVVAGTFTEGQKQTILDSLDEGEYFIPSVVGLPERKFGDEEYETDEELDHSWFEFDGADPFEETNEVPTVDVSAEALVAAFECHAGAWPLIF